MLSAAITSTNYDQRVRKMFLEKLWLRLRGELLAFREDLGDDKDLREKAETLLKKLEKSLRSEGAQGPQRQGQEGGCEKEASEASGPGSLSGIEREWHELRRQQQPKSEASEPPAPNPRKLG
jgi:hypothetical protein